MMLVDNITMSTGGPTSVARTATTANRSDYKPHTPIEKGVCQTVEYHKVAFPPVIELASPDAQTFLPQQQQQQQQQQQNRNESSKRICFVTSVYGDSLEQLDTIPSALLAAPNVLANPNGFVFLLFTNLPGNRRPGWQTVVLPLPYDHHILNSRFAKFVSWKIPLVLDACQTVFYADGSWLPTRDSTFWKETAQRISKHPAGLFQMKHESTGPLEELQRVKERKKDDPDALDREGQYLLAQADFNSTSPMYSNMAFGYDPHNANYQNLSSFFWNRYSAHEGSWRDQPFWSYTLTHFGVIPGPLGHWPNDMIGDSHSDVPAMWTKLGQDGFGGHQYVGRKRRRGLPKGKPKAQSKHSR